MNDPSALKRTISSRDNVGLTASVLQKNDLLFHTFVTDVPAIIFLRRGKKTITAGGKKIVIRPGDAVAIAAGTTCDVLNETENSKFESTWIVCDLEIIKAFEKRNPRAKSLKGATPLKGLGHEFESSFQRAVHGIKSQHELPESIAQVRIEEVLTWLLSTGSVFKSEAPSNLNHRVRLMIGAEPSKDWSAGEISDALAMSEATLRRRLSEQKLKFSDILIDVRMTTALTLIQVTDLPISEIAYQVGYESASRFSVRFKQRFGFSPTAVRGKVE